MSATRLRRFCPRAVFVARQNTSKEAIPLKTYAQYFPSVSITFRCRFFPPAPPPPPTTNSSGTVAHQRTARFKVRRACFRRHRVRFLWRRTHPGLLTDIKPGGYFNFLRPPPPPSPSLTLATRSRPFPRVYPIPSCSRRTYTCFIVLEIRLTRYSGTLHSSTPPATTDRLSGPARYATYDWTRAV